MQAIVAAVGFDERTSAAWWARSGRQGQADALRSKKQGSIGSMALARMVQPRVWLGGGVSAQRALL